MTTENKKVLKLKPFQEEGVKQLIPMLQKYQAAILADEMGLGKTIQAIQLIKHFQPKKVLIICPASLKNNWRNEILKWTNAPQDAVQVVEGKTDTLLNKRVTIINYEVIHHYENVIRKTQIPDFTIMDECHYIKNQKAKRTTSSLTIFQLSKRQNGSCLFMSGTPISNRPIEYFGVVSNCAPHVFPALRNYWAYARKYCDAHQTRYGWDVSGASNLAELNHCLKYFTVRRLKKDVLAELPPKVYSHIEVDPDTALAKKFAEESLTLVEEDFDIEKAKFSEHISTAMMRLGMIKVKGACDFIMDTLENTDKVVVFYRHKEVGEALVEFFKEKEIETVVISGSTQSCRRQGLVEQFQNNSNVKVLLGQIIAAGVGLTMTAASTVIIVEPDWVPGNNLQAEDRCHRIGQKDSVNIFYLSVKNSLDSYITNMLREKQDVLTQILDGERDD